MRRHRTVLLVAALFFAFISVGDVCLAQGTFKIPFPFQVGGKKYTAGDYRITPKGKEEIVLRQEPNGSEIAIPVISTLPKPDQPVAEPQLLFDAVGNFEPSYTEYVTDYVLAEVWLPGQDGLLLHITKGAHSHQTVKGLKAGK